MSLDLDGIDLIEFYGAEFWLPAWWLSRRPRARRPLLVAHTDGLEPACEERLQIAGVEKQSRNPMRRALTRATRLAFTRTDAFVTASEADRRYAADNALYPASRIAVIPLGLREEYFGEQASSGGQCLREERVVFLGSWIARKGVGWVVRVLRELLVERRNLRLSLLGVGIDEGKVLSEFPVALQSRIAVRSRLSSIEILEQLSRSKVFFLPTEYEGFGLALAEAMASGCTAVTTPTGFGAELLDGVEALICPFGDLAAMKAAIERLLDDEDLRKRIASRGQQRARALRWAASVATLEGTYLNWLRER